MSDKTPGPPAELLTTKDVADRLGVSTATVRRLRRRDRDFPAPIRWSRQLVKYDAADLARFIARTKRKAAA